MPIGVVTVGQDATYVASHKILSITSGYTQAHAQVTLKGGSDKAAAAEMADKEQTILELRETNEV